MIYLHLLIHAWLREQPPDSFKGWIYDDGMIWKPFHRYWFDVGPDYIKMFDKGPDHDKTSVMSVLFDKTEYLPAADPDFFEKLEKMLVECA